MASYLYRCGVTMDQDEQTLVQGNPIDPKTPDELEKETNATTVSRASEVDGEKVTNQTATIVISAVPCCGKTNWCKEHPDSKDLESSLYSKNPDKTPNENFPNNYLDILKWHLLNSNWKYIFVSSHDTVRGAMDAAGIEYYVIYHNKSRKDEIMAKCKERGNTDEFIEQYSKNWESWMDSCAAHSKSYQLEPNEFITEELFNTKLGFLKA